MTGHTPDETETTVPADRLPLTAATERAWRLTIEHHGAVPLGAFNWPWALSLALNEAGRLRDEVRALRAERDRAFTERDIADATRIAAELAAARDQIAAVEAALLQGGQTPAVRAQQALFALSQSGQPTKGEPA